MFDKNIIKIIDHILQELFEKRVKKLNKLNKKIQEMPLPQEEEIGRE